MKKYAVYSPSEQVNTDEMLKRVKELDQSVCELALCLKWTPKIEEFITSLVAGQVDWDAGPKRYRAWVVSPTQQMPSDARVDFAFIPTAMACAALMIYRQRWPEKAAAIPNFDQTLADGLLFSTLRRFRGHGFEGIDGIFRMMSIFALGSVIPFVEAHPQLCGRFTKLVREVVAELKKGPRSAYVRGELGEDYRVRAARCLKALGISA